MTDIADKLSAEGINLTRHTAGNQKIACPKCSHTRRNKGEPCLSVKIDADGAAWNCHHCQWSGGVKEDDKSQPRYRQERRPPPVRPTKAGRDVTPEAIAWFAARKISEGTVRRNRIGLQRTYLPALNGEVDCLAFPYFRNGEAVNFKFLALGSKDFAQVKGAEKILYGLDDIADVKTAIIVEGEPDKLALEEAGFRNVVSVPDGAPKTVKAEAALDDRKFEYLGNCEAQLARLEKIILAVDADGPGEALEEELARRLGKERCWRVRWPEGSKDANDVLMEVRR
jgi:twinkle protein